MFFYSFMGWELDANVGGHLVSVRALMLSIRPKYAELIFNGRKKVELRRVRPNIERGHVVLVYVSSPVKALVGGFEVCRVIQGKPQYLWRQVRNLAGITRRQFDSYYCGLSRGYVIFARKAWRYRIPIKLPKLRQRWANFTPPQGYRYLTVKMHGNGRAYYNGHASKASPSHSSARVRKDKERAILYY